MFSGDRPDGKLVRDESKVRLFMPYLIGRRGDAEVSYEQRLDVSQTLDYLERWKADAERPPLRLLHIYVGAVVRMLHERPKVNRFIAGRRLYQRTDVAIAMSVVKGRPNEGNLRVVKQTYDRDIGLLGVFERTEAIIATARDSKMTATEREIDIVSRFPRFMIPLLPKLQKLGDWLNIMPASFARNDPLYSSFMISSLGSLGLDSAYHHLYEHGTLPVFAVVGKVRDEAVVTPQGEIVARPIVTTRYTLDERVVDGYYTARSLDLIQKYVEKPWLLEGPEDNGPGAP